MVNVSTTLVMGKVVILIYGKTMTFSQDAGGFVAHRAARDIFTGRFVRDL